MFSDAMIDLLVQDASIVGYAVDIALSGENARAHSGIGDVFIGGQLYHGLGEFGAVGMIESVGDNKPAQLVLTLDGLPGRLLSSALQADVRGSDTTLYVMVFDADGQLLRAEAAFVGFVTDYKLRAGDTNTIEVTVADEFELYEMPWYRFWTDESHQVEQAGDRICRYSSQMGEREINWGAKRDAPPFNYI